MHNPEPPFRVPPQTGGFPTAGFPTAGDLAGGDPAAGDALAGYLHARAGDFLRSLRQHEESGSDTEAAALAARSLRMASRRIAGTLHTFRPRLDPVWADGLRAELSWLSGTLAQEYACTVRLTRLLGALARLSGTTGTASTASTADRADGTAERGQLSMGAARAAALLERQLTLARTRAHSTALQALGSARFHAVADAVAVLASEAPVVPAPGTLPTAAGDAERRLLDAVAALPLGRAGHPYNAEALFSGLAGAPAEEAQDAPWHRVRRLLRLHRYALEVLGPQTDPLLRQAGGLLDRHRDAAEAAYAAAGAARTPRIAPATAYALGVLHADQRHEVEAARFAFQEVWQGSSTVRAAL
ncbi:CHAD domain-containing protein [Streptomyces yaizuensis]|uniref:CHAD domain-containing protein n=1 Tax=Streptomyces yaizuensis TaxID=2989713 RepID=A0ABQ5PB41_9ACTN|nr:CHAD domain-containing protein [Streptomyces sp. YSPA8]GLF99782.1 CHAD domain-containing protein [Streptomyces sp. YSPA8]